jgi:hypothetical protein
VKIELSKEARSDAITSIQRYFQEICLSLSATWHPAAATAKPAIFRCPQCAPPMISAEKFSALTIWQLTRRSPPLDSS